MNFVNQGWRYFKCECGYHWRETCRDYKTLSSSECPKYCENMDYGGVTPYKAIPDSYIRIDFAGNLLDGTVVEELD